MIVRPTHAWPRTPAEEPAKPVTFFDAITAGDCAQVRALLDEARRRGDAVSFTWGHLKPALVNRDRNMVRLLVTWGATVTPKEMAELPQKDREASLSLLRRCGLNLDISVFMKNIPVQIGDTVDDGSVYLGQHGGQYWYVAAQDAMSEAGERLTIDFNAASGYAKELTVHGHNDWRLPSWYMLNVMHTFKAEGAFLNTYHEDWNTLYYLSGQRDIRQPQLIWQLAFMRKTEGCYHETNKGFVRCIRSGQAPGAGRGV